MSTVNMPTTAMTAPTTSSLRSSERVSQKDGETVSGGGGGEDLLLLEGAFPLSLPDDLDPALDFLDGDENGVLSGMVQVGLL